MSRRFHACFLIAAAIIALATPAMGQQGFGKAVLVADDAVFVGEPDNTYQPGMVHLFAKEGGQWGKVGEVSAPEGRMADQFGQSLALDGDRLIVGSTGGDGHPGAAYVFEKSADQWVHRATLSSAEATADDRFGVSVAVAGHRVFVGAPSNDDAPGATYVFEQGGDGSWSQTARLEGSETSDGSRFGNAVVAEGDRVFVGAPLQNDEAGGVYVFEQSGGRWIEDSLLEGRITGPGDRYGLSLDLRGGELVVGIPYFGNRVGGAIIYREEEGRWQGTALLLPYAARNAPSFGTAVSFSGDGVWVGAPQGDLLDGTAYRFDRDDDGEFVQAAMLRTTDLAQGDRFGSALDVRGNVGAIGIQGDDYGAGSVAIFERDDDGTWNRRGVLRSTTAGLQPITGGLVNCQDGEADLFSCNQVDLLSFLPISSLGGSRGVNLNDIWGWTDPATDREYALVGRVDGVSFVDVTDPYNPRYLGNLPKTEGSPGAAWRDIKVYQNYAYVVADGSGAHGMQVFDLTRLRDAGAEPETFEPTYHYTRINSAHNIVINTDTGFAYAVGSGSGGETCGGGLHMINLKNPSRPEFAGCYSAVGTGRAGTGYTHDAQCIIYEGPDTEHSGRELCFGSNETDLNIADVTDKENPVSLATASYPNVSYTHQGWISEDQRHFYVNDELDEIGGNVDQTRTLIWDISDIDDPQLVKEYMWGNRATDHNLYIRGNLMYQSNYVSGLRIHDISDPENPREVGFFDTMPVGEDEPGFAGSWSNYPFFQSGTIAVSSIGEGLFLLRKNQELGL